MRSTHTTPMTKCYQCQRWDSAQLSSCRSPHRRVSTSQQIPTKAPKRRRHQTATCEPSETPSETFARIRPNDVRTLLPRGCSFEFFTKLLLARPTSNHQSPDFAAPDQSATDLSQGEDRQTKHQAPSHRGRWFMASDQALRRDLERGKRITALVG
jgi:hypothetical protein